MMADAMKFMGADVLLQPFQEAGQGRPGAGLQALKGTAGHSEVVFACLNKNVILLHEEEFTQLGQGKSCSIPPLDLHFDLPAPENMADQGNNYFICDTEGALGDSTGN